MMNQHLKLTMVLSLIVTLSACGSGGNDGDKNSDINTSTSSNKEENVTFSIEISNITVNQSNTGDKLDVISLGVKSDELTLTLTSEND